MKKIATRNLASMYITLDTFQLLRGWLKTFASLKHSTHIRHIGHVPFIEGLVEGECVIANILITLDRGRAAKNSVLASGAKHTRS